MIKLFKNKMIENFKTQLDDNINNIIELWCLVKWCDRNQGNSFAKSHRKEWSKELFDTMWSICKVKVKNKSGIINDIIFKKNNLNNQDSIINIITDTFKKYNMTEHDIKSISIACVHGIEGICKALDFEFDNHLDDYINDVLG